MTWQCLCCDVRCHAARDRVSIVTRKCSNCSWHAETRVHINYPARPGSWGCNNMISVVKNVKFLIYCSLALCLQTLLQVQWHTAVCRGGQASNFTKRISRSYVFYDMISVVTVNPCTITDIAVISRGITAILEILLRSCASDIVHSKCASGNIPVITSTMRVARRESKLSKSKSISHDDCLITILSAFRKECF